MVETIKEIFYYVAPIIAGVITTIVIPAITNRQTVKYLKVKIDSVNEANILKEIKNELKEIRRENAELKREILEMRGKVK